MLDAEDDIGADIKGAMDSLSAGAETPAPEPVSVGALEIAPTEQTAETALKAESTDGPARGADGKFITKDDKPAEAVQALEIKAPEAAANETPTEDIVPPTRLSPEAKAQFKDWPPLARQEFRRAEADMARGVQKLQGQLERYAPLEATLAPHREKWHMQGLDDAKVVQMLVSAHNYLERSPAEAIAYLSRQYGLSPSQPGTATPAPAADPQVQQLLQKISTLEQRQQAQDQTAQQHQHSQIHSTIQAFADAKDPAGAPKHLYFEDVRAHMAALMEVGQADSLETAYEMATWARPDIRKLILAQERTAQDQAARERQAQHATQAKAAAGSITGAGGSSVRAAATDPNASIEDDIRSAMQTAGGRV